MLTMANLTMDEQKQQSNEFYCNNNKYSEIGHSSPHSIVLGVLWTIGGTVVTFCIEGTLSQTDRSTRGW